jgi:hypothetical protein
MTEGPQVPVTKTVVIKAAVVVAAVVVVEGAANS